MLFNLANSLRSLTVSPATNAVAQAHKMARRRLETGGAAAARRTVNEDTDAPDYAVPPDVDALAVASAIRDKLGISRRPSARQDRNELHPLERRLGGRVVLPAFHLLRAGDGHYERGKRFMHGVVARVRADRRMRAK